MEDSQGGRVMKYTKYQQGEDITLEEMKYYLRIVDDTHDAELSVLLKSATLYVQEYFNVALVACSVVQEQPQADTSFKLFLSDRTNIQVKDWGNNAIDFSVVGDNLNIGESKAVKISYDCEPITDTKQYAPIVYQIAGANYDGQAEQIQKILNNYPVML